MPKRLVDVYRAQMGLIHKEWRETRDESTLDRERELLERIEAIDCNDYATLLQRAIWHFVVARDVEQAIRTIRRCRELEIKDVTWRVNYAFLLAYQGDVQQAWKQYSIAFRLGAQPRVVIETEEFIHWILKEEPEKYQLHYCLGIVNYLGKCDPVTALEEFETFLAKTGKAEKRYRRARGHARSLVARIRFDLDRDRSSNVVESE